MSRSGFINVLRDWRRADKGNGFHFRVYQKGINTFAAAMHDIKHAFRQAGLLQQFNDKIRSQRDFFARFEDKRIPAGHRQWKHPHRHHRWEIERRDTNTDAERLIRRLAINSAGELLERVAHQERWYTAGVFDVFDPAINAPLRFRQRFAVLARHGLADSVKVVFE